MTLIIVGMPLYDAWCQRQNRLSPVECLNLAFLINAKHHGPDWRIDIQPHNFAGLFNKQGISRELERFLTLEFPIPRLPRPALRIAVSCIPVDFHTARQDHRIRAAMALRRRHELQSAVLVFLVLPAHEFLCPCPYLVQAPKRLARVVRAVLAAWCPFTMPASTLCRSARLPGGSIGCRPGARMTIRG